MTAAQSSTSEIRHTRVLEAAAELFMEAGYHVTMDAVAQRAGVSKQTVYAHFGSKEALFRAVLNHLLQPLHASLEVPNADLRASLHAFAEQHLEQLFDERRIATWRILIAEAPRFPDEARTLFEEGMGSTLQRLAARLARAMNAGELRRDDPLAAAEVFLSLLGGLEGYRRLLGISGHSRRAGYAAWAWRAVELFLDAYEPGSPTDRQESP